LNAIPLRTETMVLVCRPDHRFANRENVTAEDLKGESFIAFDHDLIIRKEIDRFLRQKSVNVSVTMAFDNIETIKQSILVGTGVSILPAPTVQYEKKLNLLTTVALVEPQITRSIGIIHRQRKVLTPTCVKFMELLTETMHQERDVLSGNVGAK